MVWEINRRAPASLITRDDLLPDVSGQRHHGITTYLQDGGIIEHAQQIANHESSCTTKLYDRASDAVSLDEIERILI